MFADSQIVTGHPWGADLAFLVAVILLGLAAVFIASRSPRVALVAAVFVPLGAAFGFLGLLVQ